MFPLSQPGSIYSSPPGQDPNQPPHRPHTSAPALYPSIPVILVNRSAVTLSASVISFVAAILLVIWSIICVIQTENSATKKIIIKSPNYQNRNCSSSCFSCLTRSCFARLGRSSFPLFMIRSSAAPADQAGSIASEASTMTERSTTLAQHSTERSRTPVRDSFPTALNGPSFVEWIICLRWSYS